MREGSRLGVDEGGGAGGVNSEEDVGEDWNSHLTGRAPPPVWGEAGGLSEPPPLEGPRFLQLPLLPDRNVFMREAITLRW